MMNKKSPMPKSSGKDAKAGASKHTSGMKKMDAHAPMKDAKKMMPAKKSK